MDFWKNFLVFSTDNKTKIAFVSTENDSDSFLFDIPWEYPVIHKKPQMFLDKFESCEDEDKKAHEIGKSELKELSVVNIAVHQPTDQLAFTASDKTLFICKIQPSKVQVLSRRVFLRTSSVMRFSKCGKIVVLADKTGDTFEYSVEEVEKPGRWIFGHISQVLDLQLRSDLKVIITPDRDEKIRVTNYPDTHEIESICLGHTEFVSSIAFVENEKLLLTSSGDKTLRLWEYQTGKEVFKISLEFIPITIMVGDKFMAVVDYESSVHIFRYDIDENQKITLNELGLKKYSGNINTCNDADTFYVEYLDSQKLLVDKISVLDDAVTFEVFRNTEATFNHSVHESFSIFKPFDVSLLFKKKFDNSVKPYIDRKKVRIETAMAKKMKLDEKI